MSSTTVHPAAVALPVAVQARRALPWIAGWLLLMLVVAVAGRQATRELDVFQIMEMRSLMGLVLLIPLVRMAGGSAVLRSRQLPRHVGRNIVHYAAQYGWFLALTLIPLGQVVAIEFTMPIWTVLLAALFLGERLHRWKVAAVLLGAIGVAMIARPAGGAGIGAGQAIALAAALGFAVSVILVKSLARTEQPVTIMFWMLLVQSVLGLLPALAVWRWPSPQAWGWVALIAFAGTYAHYCMASAMRQADATVVVPMDFLRVPLTAMAGWLLYAERIDLLMVLGTALILVGNLLNLWRAPRA
ncbi:DMT family transporter [Pseudorhodoferax sp.]|uniref:DMT family transporter n=1 Tax=Pseudorhodoferax sp. TaxID=1993553 RepID=UPI002DD68115|nr:DMT family transporter [Pseudorhodoferax sp.]